MKHCVKEAGVGGVGECNTTLSHRWSGISLHSVEKSKCNTKITALCHTATPFGNVTLNSVFIKIMLIWRDNNFKNILSLLTKLGILLILFVVFIIFKINILELVKSANNNNFIDCFYNTVSIFPLFFLAQFVNLSK